MKVVNDLFSISLGLNAKAIAKTEVLFVQGADFALNQAWNLNAMGGVDESLIKEQHWLKRGDLLLLSKGRQFYAKTWDKDELAVASSSYYILRPTEKILSEYLVWMFNNSNGQDYLHGHATGQTVKSISKKTIGNFKIPLVSIEKQQQVLSFVATWEKEKEKRLKYIEEKEKWLEFEISQRLKAASNG